MPQDSQKYEALRQLIDSTDNKELQCREYLQHVHEVLAREIIRNDMYVERERRGNSGDSDYVFSCRVCDGTMIEPVRAYVWELKAPQCHIFSRDTDNRLRPTNDLINAENQLLHYHHELQGNDDFKREHSITHSDNIVLGGIIIGCHTTRVQGNYPEDKKERLFEKAMTIRQKYFYNPCNLRVLTWSFILDLFRPTPVPQPNLESRQPVLVDPESLDIDNITLSSPS
jgi:hypothetical protein